MAENASCRHIHGVGGACIYCGLKRPDHDSLLALLRAKMAEIIEEDALSHDSIALLGKAFEVREGTRVKPGFMGMQHSFNLAFAEKIGDQSRRDEFEVEIFRIWNEPVSDAVRDRVDEFVRDSVAYELETSPYEHEQRMGADVRRRRKVEASIAARDALAWAVQHVYRGESYREHAKRLKQELFLQEVF